MAKTMEKWFVMVSLANGREFQFEEPTLASAKALVCGLKTNNGKIRHWSIQPRGVHRIGISSMHGKLSPFYSDVAGSELLLASFKKSRIYAK